MHALARVQELVGGGRPQRRPLLRQQRSPSHRTQHRLHLVYMQPSAFLCICYVSHHRSHRCTCLAIRDRGVEG